MADEQSLSGSTLPGNPSGALGSAPRQYVDADNQGLWDPSDQSLLTWTFDPMHCDGSAGVQASVNGVFLQNGLKLDAPATVTGITYAIRGAGATLTSGQSLIGLFDASGTRVAVTADQSTSWTSAGLKTTPWASAPALAAGIYYAEILSNGTTRPTFVGARAYDSGPSVIGRSAAGFRFGLVAASATAMPTSKPTPTAAATPVWLALY